MHVEDDDDLELEGDWNLLRGRTVPDEVYTIVEQGQPLQAPWEKEKVSHTYRVFALIRVTCHGFRVAPAAKGEELFWEARLAEVLYEEPGVNLLSWTTGKGSIEVAQRQCFSTREMALVALHERRQANLTYLESRALHLQGVAKHATKMISQIQEIVAAWPALAAVDAACLMEGRVPIPQRDDFESPDFESEFSKLIEDL